jgi:penicillin G amidase
MKTLRRLLLMTFVVVVGATLAGGWFARSTLRGSLPALDGTMPLAGLAAPVTVTRDAIGVPTLTGQSRTDVARALGFLHAQDRFFQMDLQRRQPAGELSALVGARAFEVDAEARRHRFRHAARAAYERAEPEWRALLDAYAAGVNAGLAQLAAAPFEYHLLRTAPEALAARRRHPHRLRHDRLAAGTSGGVRADQRATARRPARTAVPPAHHRRFDVGRAGRRRPDSASTGPRSRSPRPADDRAALHRRAARPRASACDIATWLPCLDPEFATAIGSNNWAVDGAHTASGSALLANDMHLQLGVPNIWYRASMIVPDPADPLQSLALHGVTLPGLPVLVVGSNGHVAWGFTNTGGDWSDLVRIEPDPRDATRYLTPGGSTAFEVVTESVAIKGDAPRAVEVRTTIWGPIVWSDADGREYAQRWVAHDADVMAGDLSRPERTRSVDEMMVAVVGLGVPHQNVTMADRAGRVAWTVGGAMPRRRGFSGFTPTSWADGTRGWDGYLDFTEVPRIVDPEQGRIWTANAPVVDGVRLDRIGDGGYSDGIRAHIIRDRLLSIERATPAQMLDVQLDDSARFLERWRDLARSTLTTSETATPVDRQAPRQEFLRLLETTWTGRASTDSVAYRLARSFRTEVVRRVLGFVTEPARRRDPRFDITRALRTEGPVWALVEARPLHLLDPRFASWDALLLDAVDEAIAELTRDGRTLAQQTWGEANRAQIVHPLASAVPLLSRWLDMPSEALPGDAYTPRAQSPRTGPSQRLVVSPGREADAVMQMPTGQSAHPLSPFFGVMHRAWVEGTPTPLLPGPAAHTLTFHP